MFELSSVNKEYVISRNNNIKVHALSNINLEFDTHGLVAIIGKSGSGKTTLLNMIGMMDTPTSGTILFDGVDVQSLSNHEIDQLRNTFIGLIFQDFNLLYEYNVIDNIKIALRLQQDDETVIDRIAKDAIESVGLQGLEFRKINSLSGGQMQRVAIARAIAKDSRILLCDEPTGNLDSQTSQSIINLLKKVSEDRLVIIITHDQEGVTGIADRVIHIQDGKVSIDTNNISKIKSSHEDNIPLKQDIEKYLGMSVRDMWQMVFDNFRHSLFITILVLLLLVATFSLTTVFISMTKYNTQNALTETLQMNNEYVIQVTKYIDMPREYPISGTDQVQIINGPVIVYEEVTLDDIEYLYEITHHQATFYPSYFLNKNLQDFTTSNINILGSNFSLYQVGFRELISVSDFSTLHLILRYGEMPSNRNDVLIYDYMAYNLIHYGVFDEPMSGIVGSYLQDQQTGLSMKITGIIYSQYEDLLNIDGTPIELSTFLESYLTSLQSIYCFPELLESVNSESNYHSIMNSCFQNLALGTFDSDAKKIKMIDITSMTILASTENFADSSGVVLSKAQLASILGISVSEIDESIAQEFIESYYFNSTIPYYDYSIERSYYYQMSLGVIAVVESMAEEDSVVYVKDSGSNTVFDNGSFRQIYLSMGTNWEVNRTILQTLNFQTQSSSFYVANPDYYYSSFTDYTPYGILISQSNDYLNDVKNFSKLIVAILEIVSVLGIFFFTISTMRKYAYKIGVLKAFGTRNSDISLIYGFEVILLAGTAFLISIPLSYFLMNRINHIFVMQVHQNLIFFGIQAWIIIILGLIYLAIVLLCAAYPLIRFYYSSPINIIRKNRNM